MINKNTYLRSHTKFTDNIIHKKRIDLFQKEIILFGEERGYFK